MSVMSEFDLYFWISGIIGILSTFALLYYMLGREKNPDAMLIGILICSALSGTLVMTTMGVFSFGSKYDPAILVVEILTIAALAIINIGNLVESSLGRPAKLRDGTYFAENSSEIINGVNRALLRKPSKDKGSEKIYQIPKNTQILTGQTIEVKNGEISII